MSSSVAQPAKPQIPLKALLSPVVVICLTVVLVVILAGIIWLQAVGNENADTYVNYVVDAVKWAALLAVQIIVGRRVLQLDAKADIQQAATHELLNGFMAGQMNEVMNSRQGSRDTEMSATMNQVLDERAANDSATDVLEVDNVLDTDDAEVDPTDESFNDTSKNTED